MRQVQPETLPKNSNLPVYKISSLKITPPKTPNSGQFSYPLLNIVSFLFEICPQLTPVSQLYIDYNMKQVQP